MNEEKEVKTENSTPIIYPINLIDVLIVLMCGIVLVYTAMNGSPSETIIGGFMGYLGANIKNGNSASKTTTTTTNRNNITPQPEKETTPEEQLAKITREAARNGMFCSAKIERTIPIEEDRKPKHSKKSELNDKVKKDLETKAPEPKEEAPKKESEIFKVEQ